MTSNSTSIEAKSLSLIAEQLLAEFKIYEDSAYSYAGNYLRLWSGRSLLWSVLPGSSRQEWGSPSSCRHNGGNTCNRNLWQCNLWSGCICTCWSPQGISSLKWVFVKCSQRQKNGQITQLFWVIWPLLGAQQMAFHYTILLGVWFGWLHRQRWSSGSNLILITMHLRWRGVLKNNVKMPKNPDVIWVFRWCIY